MMLELYAGFIGAPARVSQRRSRGSEIGGQSRVFDGERTTFDFWRAEAECNARWIAHDLGGLSVAECVFSRRYSHRSGDTHPFRAQPRGANRVCALFGRAEYARPE